MVFSARQLRSVRYRPRLLRMLRQPLAMNVDRLHRARAGHKQKTRKRQQTQPQSRRVLNRSALGSIGQVFRKENRLTAPISSSMTQIQPCGTRPPNFVFLICRALPLACCPNRLRQRRHNLKQVAHHADIRDLEDRRIRVFVDRNHRLCALHAHQMLDRAGDANREV
jgi:hypothetical protein